MQVHFTSGGGAYLTAGLGYHNHMYVDLFDNATSIPFPDTGKDTLVNVRVDQKSCGAAVTFTITLNGMVALTFTDTAADRINTVSGANVGLRGFRGPVTFTNLTMGAG